MKHTQILKRAWRNVLSYRGLWIFGVFLALTTFSGGWSFMGDLRDEPETRWEGIQVERRHNETFLQAFERTMEAEFERANQALEELFATEFGINLKSDIVTYLVILAAAGLILYVAGRVIRYVSETALIHMVDRHEESGEQLKLRQGLRLGWSRAAWRLFLIDLVVSTAAVAIVIALFALILTPIALWVDGGETAILIGAFLTGSLLLLAIFAGIIFAGLVTLLRLMARRACVLEGLTVIDSIRRGIAVVRGYLKDTVLMGVVAMAIKAIWPVVIGMALLLTFSGSLLLGILPAAILANLSDPATLPAAILGGIFFIVLVVAPLVFLEGLLQVFFSNVWTLAYRQLCGLEIETEETAPATPMPDAALPVPSA
jgi:hypothetical protein